MNQLSRRLLGTTMATRTGRGIATLIQKQRHWSSSYHHRCYSIINSFRSSISNIVGEQHQYYINNQQRPRYNNNNNNSNNILRFISTTNVNYNDDKERDASTTTNNIRDRAREQYFRGKQKYEERKATAKIKYEERKATAKIKYEERKASAKIKYEEGRVVVQQKYEEGKVKGTKLAKKGAMTSYQMLKQYGPVFIGTYASIYLATLGGLYGGVSSGMIDPIAMMDYLTGTAAESSSSDGTLIAGESRTLAQVMIDYLNHYSWTQPAVPFLEKNPGFANLAVAWVGTKVTEPARIFVCIAIVPKLADYLGFVASSDEEEEER